MRATLFLLTLLWALTPAGAEPAVPALDGIARELDAIVADLQTAQERTEALGRELETVRAQAAEHQRTLGEQRDVLTRYERLVAGLEAHDRASIELAQTLQAQVQQERAWSGWLGTLAAVAVTAALVEGWLLWQR